MNTLLICLQNEAAVMTSLVELLRQEQTALTQAPDLALMEEIGKITQEKNQLVSKIAQLTQLRHNELNRLGLKQVETSPNWLQDKDQSECWETLMQHTKKAKELNRVNGLLVNRHLMRNQNTLQLLYKNHPTGATAHLYDASGQSNAGRSTNRGVIV